MTKMIAIIIIIIIIISVLLKKYNSGDQLKKNEIGGACGTYGRQERCIQGFVGET
jgi:preprotein translocase subunit SecG